MYKKIADCAKEIIDSFEKNGYYLDDGRFFQSVVAERVCSSDDWD